MIGDIASAALQIDLPVLAALDVLPTARAAASPLALSCSTAQGHPPPHIALAFGCHFGSSTDVEAEGCRGYWRWYDCNILVIVPACNTFVIVLVYLHGRCVRYVTRFFFSSSSGSELASALPRLRDSCCILLTERGGLVLGLMVSPIGFDAHGIYHPARQMRIQWASHPQYIGNAWLGH